MTTAATVNVRIRPSTLDDYDAIVTGIGNDMAMVSRAEYLHRWSTNPFQPPDQRAKTGWLMETEAGRVVGWFGNIFSGYELDGRALLAASTHAVVVNEAYRSRSLSMVMQFFRQPGVDLLLVTTSNEKAGEVWRAMKMVNVPHPSYDRVLYWVTRPARFVAAGLRRKGAPLATPAGLVLGAGLGLTDMIGGRRLAARRTSAIATPKLIEEFDDRFDSFWAGLRQRRGRLLAVRTREALAWHFHDAGATGRRAIVVIEDDKGLAGYVILVRRDAAEIGLRRYGVADLQVKRDDPQLVRALMAGAWSAARAHGVDVLEVTGFDSFKRGVIESMRPRVRQSPSWPYLYKAQSSELASALSSPSAWDACPYDGDAAF